MLLNQGLDNIDYLVSRQTIEMLNKNLNNFSKQQMISSKREEGKDDVNERKIYKMKELQRKAELEIDNQNQYYESILQMSSSRGIAKQLNRIVSFWFDFKKSVLNYYDNIKIIMVPLFFKTTDEQIKESIIKSLKEVNTQLKELYTFNDNIKETLNSVNTEELDDDDDITKYINQVEQFNGIIKELKEIIDKMTQTYQILTNNKDKLIEVIPDELMQAFDNLGEDFDMGEFEPALEEAELNNQMGDEFQDAEEVDDEYDYGDFD
jgi:hypothetical protein